MKTVFITGATSGIGRACAEKFAANQFNVIITGRRKQLLEELKKELEQYHVQVTAMCFDVQDSVAAFDAVNKLPEDQQVDILINNAGLALGREAFDEADMADWEIMLATNVNGLLYMSRALMPFIKNAK